MKKLIAATALTAIFATGAFAEGVQQYNRTAMETMAEGDTAVVDIMMGRRQRPRRCRLPGSLGRCNSRAAGCPA